MPIYEEKGQLRSSLRQTHTYVVLEISQDAYDEIRRKLIEAGYDHVFGSDSNHDELIDMHGIALAVEEEAAVPQEEDP